VSEPGLSVATVVQFGLWSQAPSTAPATLHVGDESVDVATLAWMEMAETLKLEKEPKSCKLWLSSSSLIVATINFRGGKRIAVCVLAQVLAGSTARRTAGSPTLCQLCHGSLALCLGLGSSLRAEVKLLLRKKLKSKMRF
jgi:hypothetical protein